MQTALSPSKSTTVRAEGVPTGIRLGFQLLEKLSPALALTALNRVFARPARHPWPAEEQKWLALAERKTLFSRDMPLPEWDGKALAVYRWRPTTAMTGRVLLMHGWAGRATQLWPFLPGLLAAGKEVIALDAPGHGHSHGRWSSLLQFSRALQRVVRELGPIDGTITHSFGGPSLLHAMTEGLTVPKAVLIAPPIRVLDFTQALVRTLGLSEASRQRLHAHWEEKLGIRFADLDAIKMAAELHGDALIIHDQHDRDVPHSRGALLAEAWPNATLLSTTGLGHRRVLKDPAVVAAALAHLR
ncbi:alpha/beta hydrolase [Permianibacter sp. IMCC34836]|uniref:alpha/beta hydrolase n=1 Tax=Permianibacter fluminis TaxID=2738515 RepID=UPI0015577CBC|nr:alpha/beta fold hydrolase [Permianibacter fluminis]NQD35853.1 alpha/beta hydrolase [Permianibacter fluminis]